MANWTELLRERLDLGGLSPQQQQETVAELTSHLDELFEEYRTQGLNESDAVARALGEVPDWRSLAKSIHRGKRVEGIMNSRSKQFWLPALVSLTGSMVLLMLLQLAGSRIHTPWKHAGVPLLPYAIWIATLPLVGAASTHLSRRAGGTRSTRNAAILFPSIVMLVVWLVILATLLARKSAQPLQTVNFLYGVAFWVIVPGAALLLGTLLMPKRRRAHA